jgi:hypothetical protein
VWKLLLAACVMTSISGCTKIYYTMLSGGYMPGEYVMVRRIVGHLTEPVTPTAEDKTIGVSIGPDNLRSFHGDRLRAAAEISSRVIEEYKLCPAGYTVDAKLHTGPGGGAYSWIIRCN